MEGNNGNKSHQNQPVNKMEQASTRHQPRRAVRNAANARAAAQAAPQVRVSGPVRTRKAPRKNTPYARPSNNGAKNKEKKKSTSRNLNRMKNAKNEFSLSGLSFGNSSFSMNAFNKKRPMQSYAPKFVPSAFVPLNAQQAFQSRLNQNVAAQVAANQQHLANVAVRRSLGAKKAAATRKAKKEAAEAALRAAMEDVREAEGVVVAQEQSANGVSPKAQQALVNAQRAAQNADRAFHRALLDIDLNENNGSAASAASAASANNLSSMFGRL
jgi:hypothetical protein